MAATTASVLAGCGSSEDSASDDSTTTTADGKTSTTAASTTAAPNTTAASGGSCVMSGVPAPTCPTAKSGDSIPDCGEHIYYTAPWSATDFVAGYESQLSGVGWSADGGGSGEIEAAGLTATSGGRYLVLEAGGPSDGTFADLCVWPQKPSDDDCGEDSDDDDSDDDDSDADG